MATIWIANYPLSSTVVSSSTEQIRINWDAIEDWWTVSHTNNFSAAASGAHTPGIPGIILYDATSGVSAVSSPGTGALAYDSTKGEVELYRYDSTNLTAGWERLTAQKFSRVRASFATQSIPDSTWTKLTETGTGSGTYDTMSEYSTVTDKVIPVHLGWFVAVATIQFPSTSDNYNKAVAVCKNGTIVSRAAVYGSQNRTVILTDTVQVTTASSDYFEIYAWHNAGTAVSIVVATLHLSRLN